MKPKEDKVAEVVNRISEWEAAAYAAHAQAICDSPRQGVQAGPREPLAKAVDALRPDTPEEAGHYQGQCTKTVLCSICKSLNHCDSMHPKNNNKSKVVRQKGEGRWRSQKDSSSGKSRDGRKSERGRKPGGEPPPS